MQTSSVSQLKQFLILECMHALLSKSKYDLQVSFIYFNNLKIIF